MFRFPIIDNKNPPPPKKKSLLWLYYCSALGLCQEDVLLFTVLDWLQSDNHVLSILSSRDINRNSHFQSVSSKQEHKIKL